MCMVEMVDHNHGDVDLDSDDHVNDAVDRANLLKNITFVEIVDHDHGDYDLDSDDHVDNAVVRAYLADFYIKLFNTTAADDRHGFIELMKSLDARAYREYQGYKKIELYELDSCPLEFFGRICGIGALDCLTALLEGESGLILDLKLDPEVGKCPLHVAANQMSYNVIDLLLRYGAQTDLKSKETRTGRGGLLPLSVALEKLSYHESLHDWSPKDSALKLIMKLCLPNMKIPLEVNRLLALNTERVDDIFYYYAMEGKLVEMAALLMVAREKVMGGSGGNMDIRQHLIEEIASITRDEIKLIGCGNGGKWAPVFKDKKLVMTSALDVLEIFERAGDCIGAYVRSVQSDMTEQEAVKGIIVLLEENGFIVKSEDIHLSNIDCTRYSQSGKTKLEARLSAVSEKRSVFGYPLQDLGMPVLSRSSHSFAEKNANKYLDMNEAKEALSPLRFFRPGSSSLLKSYPSWSNDPFEKRKASTQKSLQDLLSAKTYGRFGLLIKRGIRRI